MAESAKHDQGTEITLDTFIHTFIKIFSRKSSVVIKFIHIARKLYQMTTFLTCFEFLNFVELMDFRKEDWSPSSHQDHSHAE